MQKLSITYVTLENGKKERRTTTAIVASTKSQNSLLRAMEEEDKFPIKNELVVKEVFVDKAKTENALATAFAGVGDADTVKALVAHAMAALDGACMFVRPQVDKK